ncbi:MAG: hypothetical protein E6K72_13690 [Candidatus Eisenbacteria bacterium]|uniref:Uncharacterized protein n=1 Tax=Eiseniibacteriota bacterium TaxID=2212470 RepID=A0A538S8R2_UNCEI|nr:MAG: hypothetical protein E6K72_13690 [Candidatus Eisenbacteria bacterium]
MLADIDPKIGKRLAIGTDFREIYYAADPSAGQAVQQGFFQMQGDIYLSFQLDSAFTLYYNRGLTNTYELFGIAHWHSGDGYIKAGRFVPSYGWRFDDHTMYVRSEQGFFPPAFTDVGLELGFQPKRLDLQVAIRLRYLRPALRHQFTVHPGVLDPVVEDRVPRIARLNDQHWRVDEAGHAHEGAIGSENASEIRCRPAGVARETPVSVEDRPHVVHVGHPGPHRRYIDLDRVAQVRAAGQHHDDSCGG